MDRQLVYPGAIPLETDLLNTNRYALIGLGRLAMDLFGVSTSVSGLACTPTAPASMSVKIGAGAIYALENVDDSAFSSLPANTTDQIVKQGILQTSAHKQLALTAPTTAGYSVIYLIEAAFSEIDGGNTVLPFYNASDPTVAYSGPGGSGAASSTVRQGAVNVIAKPGVASATPVAPAVDSGFVPLYYVTVSYGQTTITTASIALAPNAPFLSTLTAYAPLANPAFTTGISVAGNITLTAAIPTILFGAAGPEIGVKSGGRLSVFSDNGGRERIGVTSDGYVMIGGARPGINEFPNYPGAGNMRVSADTAGGFAISTYDTQDYTAWQGNRDVSGTDTIVGSITCTISSTAYNTSSDYRLKSGVVPITGALDRVMSIPACRFYFLVDQSQRLVDGFLAHEAALAVPEAVHGAKDAVDANGAPLYQQIDQSKLVPVLWAAVQELKAALDAATARIATLESHA